MNVTMIDHCADQFEVKFYHKVSPFLVEVLRNYSICIFFVRCILGVGIRLNCFIYIVQGAAWPPCRRATRNKWWNKKFRETFLPPWGTTLGVAPTDSSTARLGQIPAAVRHDGRNPSTMAHDARAPCPTVAGSWRVATMAASPYKRGRPLSPADPSLSPCLL
jgi:hypothetical protein